MNSNKKCPGTDGRNNFPEEIVCPKCKTKAEIFKDEAVVKCRKCGALIYRDGDILPSCLEWCAYAEECVGKEKYQEWLKHKKISQKRK